jgi:hypothetical protein
MRAHRQVALFATRNSVAALFLHGGKTSHVETGAEGPALTGQHHCAQTFFPGKPIGRVDQRLKHRLIERVHLVRPHQADVGDAFRNRDRDALFHGPFSPVLER